VHALGRAILSADVDVFRFLVEHGCDLNEPGYGTTIRYARQYLPSLEYLLSKGAKVEKDALSQSAQWQDPTLIAQWIDRGADVNAATGPYNRTPLMTATASEQASAAIVKLLLERGANPTPKTLTASDLSTGLCTAQTAIRSLRLNNSAPREAMDRARKRLRPPKPEPSPIRASLLAEP